MVYLGSQFICSGLEDFLLWVVLGRETQNNAQLIFAPLTLFSQIFWTLSSPNFLLFIAKVSGEIMITVTVCAIEGPILFDLSGCLGERAVLHLWSWNLISSGPIMFGNAASRAYHIFPGMIHTLDREHLTDHLLELNALHLFVYLRKLQEGRDNWTFLLGLRPKPVWDWAQGLYGPGISVPYNFSFT